MDTTSLISDTTVDLDIGYITEDTVSFNLLSSGSYTVYDFDISGTVAVQTGSSQGVSERDGYVSSLGTGDISGVNKCVKDMMFQNE